LHQVIPNIQRYREIALANHPALHHKNPNAAYQKFAKAAEAFDILYDRMFWMIKPKKGRFMTSLERIS
jgi:hypothetical protein